MKVLFVCHGNICRSPTAEGVFRAVVERAGLSSSIEITSAGVISAHQGEEPDQRSQIHALRRGFDLSLIRAKQITPALLASADYILAADRSNIDGIRRVSAPEHLGKIKLLLDYAPDQPFREVPDPYYGGADGFERVIDLIESASLGVLAEIRQRLAA